jgi:hypothetical protein
VKQRYEERSLGIFEAPLGEIKEDLAKLPSRERVGRYVSWHLRRQLSIGAFLPYFYHTRSNLVGNRYMVVSMGNFHRCDRRTGESDG